MKDASLLILMIRYRLRAVINHKPNHFTATLISEDGELFLYDDLSGIEKVTRCMQTVETGIYTLMVEEF